MNKQKYFYVSNEDENQCFKSCISFTNKCLV